MQGRDNNIFFRYNEFKEPYYTRVGKRDVSFVVEGSDIVMIENNSNTIKYKRRPFNFNSNLAFNYNWTMEQFVYFAFVSMKDILPKPKNCSDKYREFYNLLEYHHFYLSDEYKSNDKPINIYNKILRDYDILQQAFQYKLTSDYSCNKCNDIYTKETEINYVTLSHIYYTPIYTFKMVRKMDYRKVEEEYVIFNTKAISFFILLLFLFSS